MNKNTLLAILLIGGILLGFSLYNSKVAREKQREQFVKDSIAYQEAMRAAAAAPVPVAQDTLASVSTSVPSGAVAGQIYSNEYLNQALQGDVQLYTLENDKIKVVFSNKGGQPYSVQIKGFKTYGGDSLLLFQGDKNNLSFNFFAQQQIDTKDFFFVQDNVEAGRVMRFTLPMAEGAAIEYVYVLEPDSYMLQLNVNLLGMDRLIPKNVTQLDLNWNVDVRHLEKGFDNEKNYSTISYKYPNTTDVEALSLRKASANASVTTRTEWVAFQQQFFSAILYSENNFSAADIQYAFYQPNNADTLLFNCMADLQVPYQGEAKQVIPLQLYYGPNGFYALKAYDRSYEQIIPMGGWIVKWISRFVIIPIFNFLNRFISNYGLIILLMTLIIKLVVMPFTFKSYMSSAKMRVLRPEIDKINAKYPKQEDAMKKQQETMALYKKTGVSMMGGCWPSLLQMPILFAMFRFFPGSIELRQAAFLWADDLSGYDSILDFSFKIPIYGNHISLFALLMALSMFFYSRMNLKQQAQTQTMPGMNGMMLYFMPIMMLCICNNLSAALSYYYLLSNLFTMLQTWLIQQFVDEKKLRAKLLSKAATAAPPQKSKFQQRLEEAQRIQQQQQKRR